MLAKAWLVDLRILLGWAPATRVDRDLRDRLASFAPQVEAWTVAPVDDAPARVVEGIRELMRLAKEAESVASAPSVGIERQHPDGVTETIRNAE